MMIINGPEELKQWKAIQDFAETYLNREVKNELIPTVIMEVLKGLTEDLFFMTRRANCNCVDYDEYEELDKDAENLAQLVKILGKDLSRYLG